jgi:hypothetical protein
MFRLKTSFTGKDFFSILFSRAKVNTACFGLTSCIFRSGTSDEEFSAAVIAPEAASSGSWNRKRGVLRQFEWEVHGHQLCT